MQATTPTTAAGLSALRFERSEAALANLNRALGRFRSETSALRRRPALHPSRLLFVRPPTTAADWDRFRTEDAMARFMSIADDFTLGLLVDLTEARLPAEHRVSVLWDRYIDRETDNWEQRFGSWGQLHQIRLKSFPRYDRLLGFIEARNAIVHGLGSLTRKQAKSRQKSVGRLHSARIELSGSRLVLMPDHALDCAAVVKELVGWLDQQAAAMP